VIAVGEEVRVAPIVPVSELRDYRRINAELSRLLDEGHPRVRLEGVEGQRLLLTGLAGGWDAVVELDGSAGPELAAGLNAPGLLVVCQGDAADGAGSGLFGGRVLIAGDTGAVVGYAQRGGVVVVAGSAGPRAGLNQSGGTLVLLGPAGRLAGERQSGGTLFVRAEGVGPHASRDRRGGRLVAGDAHEDGEYRAAVSGLGPWIEGL